MGASNKKMSSIIYGNLTIKSLLYESTVYYLSNQALLCSVCKESLTTWVCDNTTTIKPRYEKLRKKSDRPIITLAKTIAACSSCGGLQPDYILYMA